MSDPITRLNAALEGRYVRMPFGSMVSFMVSWVIASIPAFIILALVGAVWFVAVMLLFSVPR